MRDSIVSSMGCDVGSGNMYVVLYQGCTTRQTSIVNFDRSLRGSSWKFFRAQTSIEVYDRSLRSPQVSPKTTAGYREKCHLEIFRFDPLTSIDRIFLWTGPESQ